MHLYHSNIAFLSFNATFPSRAKLNGHMKRVIITNRAYVDRPDKYRAAATFQKVVASGARPKVILLDFKAEQGSIPDNITQQIRTQLTLIMESDQLVVCMGDGGIALAVHALQILQTEVRALAQHAVGVAPGGTMNNLHTALCTNGKIGAKNTQVTRVREFEFAVDGKQESMPVVSFFGTGAEAEFLHHYERGSRADRREINIAKAGVGMANDFWRTRNDRQSSFAALAIPVWGIMNFPQEFYRLGESDMALMQLNAENGFEAASLFALYQLAGQSPDFLTWLWRREGLRHELAGRVPLFDWFARRAQEMKPQLIGNHTFHVRVTHPEGFLFHTDGTVHARPMPLGSTVQCRLGVNKLPPVHLYAV